MKMLARGWGLLFAVVFCADLFGSVDPVAFIRDELSRGRKTILVPKGVYEVDPGEIASVYLEGLDGVTVDFQGGELRGKLKSAMVKLKDCRNVTVKNLVIDYPFNLPFTQAIIESVGPDGEWDVRIVDGYPDNGKAAWPIQAYDAKTGELVNPMRMDGEKVTPLGKGRYRVTGGKNRKGKVGDVAVWSLACDTFFSTQSVDSRGHAVYLVGCADCRIENVTVYSTPGSNGFREILGPGGNVYRKCAVVPRPPEADPVKRGIRRFRSGNHDAFNSRGMRKGPSIVGCVACNHCDDDVNIHGPYQFVASAAGRIARVFVKDMYKGTLKVGDPVQFVAADGYSPVETPIVVSIKEARYTPSEYATMRKGLCRQISKACNTMVEVEFDREHPVIRAGSLFVSQNQAGNGFVLKDCRFGPNRARGFICNASYGLVENCMFDRVESYAVLSRPSYRWLEGGAARNVRFKNCTFIDCGMFLGTHQEMETTPDCHRNLVIAGCSFRGQKGVIDVRCCNGLAFDANTFELPTEKAVRLRHVEGRMVERVDYGAHPKQHFMFRRAKEVKSPAPLIVYIHGGGWNSGYAVDHGLYPIFDRGSAEGFAVAALQYRFVSEAKTAGIEPPVKAVYEDCFTAIRHLKDHATEFGIDPGRITLIGGSAGACTILQLTLKGSNPLGLYEVFPRIAQTTLDPKWMAKRLPTLHYGAQAFGVPRDEFLRRRDELMPMIRQWSPVHLLAEADPKRLPPIHLQYDHRYPDGRPPQGTGRDDSVHDAAFGDLFKGECDRLGVKCDLSVAGCRLSGQKGMLDVRSRTGLVLKDKSGPGLVR